MPAAEGTEWREVDEVPFVGGPPLGDRPDASGLAADRPLGVAADAWPAATLEWWDVVRAMPHCILWDAADWAIAKSAAEAHARFVEGWKGCASGAELRQREKQLGMSHDFRRDLRIRYVKPRDPHAPLPANVTRVDFGEL